jgi:hypothetical protein
VGVISHLVFRLLTCSGRRRRPARPSRHAAPPPAACRARMGGCGSPPKSPRTRREPALRSGYPPASPVRRGRTPASAQHPTDRPGSPGNPRRCIVEAVPCLPPDRRLAIQAQPLPRGRQQGHRSRRQRVADSTSQHERHVGGRSSQPRLYRRAQPWRGVDERHQPGHQRGQPREREDRARRGQAQTRHAHAQPQQLAQHQVCVGGCCTLAGATSPPSRCSRSTSLTTRTEPGTSCSSRRPRIARAESETECSGDRAVLAERALPR